MTNPTKWQGRILGAAPSTLNLSASVNFCMSCSGCWPISSYTALFHDWGATQLRHVQNQAGKALFDQMSGASIQDTKDGKFVNLYDRGSEGIIY